MKNQARRHPKKKPSRKENFRKMEHKLIENVVVRRNALDFKAMGPNQLYHFVRRTSLINSFNATTGSFVSNSSNCSFTQTSGSTPTDAQLAVAFRLDDLPDYTEFTNLFDQYCIYGVRVRITPRVISVNSGINASNAGPNIIYAAKSRSDNNLPGSVAAIREYTSVREYTPNTQTNTKLVMKMVPSVAVAAYSGAFSGYTGQPPRFVDTNSPNVQHYGFKFAIPAGNVSGTSNVYDLEFTYHIVCRMAQ